MKIYHNPRCSKSRKTLELVKSKCVNIEIIEYLKKPLTSKEIRLLLSKLNVQAIDLVRVNEPIWKKNYQSKKMLDNEIINIISKHPKLMKRPIVTTNNEAIIGNPPENVLKFF